MVLFPRAKPVRHRLPWTAVLLVLIAVPTALGRADAAPTSLQPRVVEQVIDGIRLEGSSTYDVDDVADRVHVTVEVRLTNLVPPRSVGRFVESSYLDVLSVPVLAEAEGVVASRDGRSLAVDVVDDDGFVAFVVVDLVPDLEYGSPQTVVVEYDLPAQPPRGESFTRINDAFVSFPLFAIGDPGAADVTVSLPSALEVEFVGEQPVRTDAGDRAVHRFDDIADPDRFFTTVAARNDDALVDVALEVSDADVVVRGWPGDADWVDFVSRSLREGIPALEELIGSDWPVADDLEIIESASPYLYGYSGWFLPGEDLIEVGDELDEQVVLHELAHLWFNDTLFEGRWISEGLAEAYANRAREQIGGEPVEPAEPDTADPGAQPLEVWSNPDLLHDSADAQERYGYTTSFLVIDRLLDEAGPDGMRAVLRAADQREISYVGDGAPETLPSAPDWRQLLDLAVDRAEVTDAADLFDRFVVAPEDRPALEERSAARAAYRDVEDAGEGWSPPYPVRLAMTEWDFDDAAELLDETEALLTRRDRMLADLAPVGVDRLAGLESTFETERAMGDVRAEFTEHEAVARRLVDADDAVEGASNPLAVIGHLGDPPGDHLRQARESFENGNLAMAEAAADEAVAISGGAVRAGVVRLLATLALLGVLAFGAVLLRRHRSVPVGASDPPHGAAS